MEASITAVIAAVMIVLTAPKAVIGRSAAIGQQSSVPSVRRGQSSAPSDRMGQSSATSAGRRAVIVRSATVATVRTAIRSCAPSTSKAATDATGASASLIPIRRLPSSRR